MVHGRAFNVFSKDDAMVWNQSRPAKARATAHSKGRYIAVIVLALTAIIVAAVLALYYSGHDSDDETFDQKRKTSLIQEAKSAPASKVASTATSEKTEVAKYKSEVDGKIASDSHHRLQKGQQDKRY